MVWVVLPVVVAALGVFGVWMKHLVDAIGKAQSSELSRIEQKIDLVHDNMRDANESAIKLANARAETLAYQIAQVDDKVGYLVDRMTIIEKGLGEQRHYPEA